MFIRAIAFASLAFGISACATFDPATRGVPLEATSFAQVAPSYDVETVRIAVPGSLSVSEANSYYPIADIVWRGDPIGNRHRQVLNIFATSVERGTKNLNGAQPIDVDIEVMRFHSLSEKARFTIGGVHSIKFKMTMRDATTGAVIGEPRVINADFPALAGRAAMAAESSGQTQKVRVTDHLSYVFEKELGRPATSAHFDL
ncbi:MAG: DUF6778 family protein [Pseudomonadota bacterium]